MAKNCMTCEKANEECTQEQIRACLMGAECEHCDNPYFSYPYGKDEGRHCTNCGAEWSIWK